MRVQSNQTGQRLEDLSKEKLVGLLRSTYQFKNFVEYFDQHDIVFMDKLQHNSNSLVKKHLSGKQEELTDNQMLKQLNKFNQENNLQLHKYHQEMILNKFKQYYQNYEEQRAAKIKAYYLEKIKKAEKQSQSTLPLDLAQICLQKERELTKQLKKKRNKTIKL